MASGVLGQPEAGRTCGSNREEALLSLENSSWGLAVAVEGRSIETSTAVSTAGTRGRCRTNMGVFLARR
jgi:hypothetical protein